MGARWSEEKTLIDDTILPLSGDYDDEAIQMDNPGFFHTDLRVTELYSTDSMTQPESSLSKVP